MKICFHYDHWISISLEMIQGQKRKFLAYLHRRGADQERNLEKLFCFFLIFLENRHQKKVFYKNNGLISSTKNSLERLLMPFQAIELLYKEVFAIRIVLFQTLYYFLWSVTLVITHRIVNERQVMRSLKNSLLLGFHP